MSKANIIDFNVVNTRVDKYQKQLGLTIPSEAFPYVVLEILLELPINEIENCIVDGSGDRGIDAIYIEEDGSKNPSSNVIIHIFQFKYTSKQEKIHNNFPGNEIDKLITIIDDALNLEPALEQEVNPALWSKIQDIHEVYNYAANPQIIIYLCSNMQDLIQQEKERIARSFKKFDSLSIKHFSLQNLANLMAVKVKRQIDGTFNFIDNQYFERSAGNVRAVIGVVSALDLVNLVEDKINPGKIEEAIFEDNIRLYQGRERNQINQAIYRSALDEETRHNFFYLNNGITMTCDKIDYTVKRHPLVHIKKFQIVNGSQTTHALFEAYQELENKRLMDEVLILLRIYETGAIDIVSQIVQTTNSQTVINSRYLRSNDPIQYKLETELRDKGFFYERKRNSYQNEERSKVLDAQVVGQALLSFYLGRPYEVKYKRREIFGKYYTEVFDENIISANTILNPMIIFQYVEARKVNFQKQVRLNDYDPKMLFIPHASFYILYGIRIVIERFNLEFSYENTKTVETLYEPVVQVLTNLVRETEEKMGKRYSHNSFFRDKKLVGQLEAKLLELPEETIK